MMMDRNKADIGKKEVKISEAVSIAFSDFDFVVKALKPACIDMEFGVSNQAIEAFNLLPSKFHKRRNTAVNSSIKPFAPPYSRLLWRRRSIACQVHTG